MALSPTLWHPKNLHSYGGRQTSQRSRSMSWRLITSRANTNSVIAAFWCTLEVFRDSDLLRAVRQEVEVCITSRPGSTVSFDIDRLLSQPILQAVYAETLRLRVNGFLIRCPLKSDLKINGYTIPQSHFVLTNSTPGHMDHNIWSTGEKNEHPLEKFWIGRFLTTRNNTPGKFTLAGSEGSWMPFGGGTHACPGRKFAKLEIILVMALMVTLYDIKVLAKERDMEMSSRNFGFGTLSPKGKIPVQIRRR